jgi:hypothetical protein
MTPSPGGGKDEKQDRYDRPTPDHEGNEAAEIEPPHSNNGRGLKEDDGAAGRARVKSRCNAEDRGSADEVARPSPNLWGQRAGPMGRHPLVDEDAHDSVGSGTASDPPWGGSGKVPYGSAVIDASGVDQRRSHMNPWCHVTKIRMPGRAGESPSNFPTPDSHMTPTRRYAGGLPGRVADRPRRRVARSAASSPSSPGSSGFGWRGFVPPGPVFVPVEWTTATVRASLPGCAASWPARGVGERDRQPMDLTRKDLRVA